LFVTKQKAQAIMQKQPKNPSPQQAQGSTAVYVEMVASRLRHWLSMA